MEPTNWWANYRAAWCYNQLGESDSAAVFAKKAFLLEPGNERCLSELLKSLSNNPEEVLQYSPLVSGGGVCRYRLARAEIDLDLQETPSMVWLQNSFEGSDSSVVADAGCWLSLLNTDNSLFYIQRAVELRSEESFYISLYIDFLIEDNMLDSAVVQFEVLKENGAYGVYFWQTASSLFGALGDDMGAIEASRRAFDCRRIPSTAATLGWKLYFYGRSLLREEEFSDAIPYLQESCSLWSRDSLWAVKSDSLLNLLNEFTSISSGFGEPL